MSISQHNKGCVSCIEYSYSELSSLAFGRDETGSEFSAICNLLEQQLLLQKDNQIVLPVGEVFYEPRELISNGSCWCCKAKLTGFEEGNESLQSLGSHCKANPPLNFVTKWAVFAFILSQKGWGKCSSLLYGHSWCFGGLNTAYQIIKFHKWQNMEVLESRKPQTRN